MVLYGLVGGRNGTVWVIGGQTSTSTPIYYSYDGVNWTGRWERTYYDLYYWETMLNILVFAVLNYLASYGHNILYFSFITYLRVSMLVSAIC